MALQQEQLESRGEGGAAYLHASTLATATDDVDAIHSDEVNALIENVNQGLVKQKQFLKNMSVVPALIPLFIAVVIALIRVKLGNDIFNEWITQPSTFLIFAGVILSAPLAISRGIRMNAKNLDAAAQKLVESHDVALVGPLIDLLGTDNAIVRKNATQALTRLLPTLQSSDASLLNQAQRTRLVRYLSVNPDTMLHKDISDVVKVRFFDQSLRNHILDFQVAILRSYEHIGGTQELPTIMRLANIAETSSINPRLREAARAVLESVGHRVGIEKQQGVLLRPSESQADDPTLLRPASTNLEAESEVLLRVPDSPL